ncbi:DedA family protein [Pelistega europaea]|uniref:DedA family protein n=1 Tax=Pelistega europaea TaxID=106147 RepID=A0A7Y4L8T1_9BURK|nr:DedA family protein [Pelistega europaea]NOL49090.1 DedA family protein [Pelistega europaea]
MQHYIDLINQFIAEHQSWSALIIGLLCFGESLLVIGIMIPATAILIFTGALVGTGTLHWAPVLVGGIIGAIIGDSVSYAIGRWLGWDITKKPLLQRHIGVFIATRKFFDKHGTLSVFLGRFMGPIRSTIPTVAGIMELPRAKFQFANIASAILWVPIMLSPGYFSAKGTQMIADKSGLGIEGILTILSVVLGVGMVAYFLIPRKHKNNTHPQENDSKDNSTK